MGLTSGSKFKPCWTHIPETDYSADLTSSGSAVYQTSSNNMETPLSLVLASLCPRTVFLDPWDFCSAVCYANLLDSVQHESTQCLKDISVTFCLRGTPRCGPRPEWYHIPESVHGAQIFVPSVEFSCI